MSKHTPCGCLTDGYNWLAECAQHKRIRTNRNDLVTACCAALGVLSGHDMNKAALVSAMRLCADAISTAKGD